MIGIAVHLCKACDAFDVHVFCRNEYSIPRRLKVEGTTRMRFHLATGIALALLTVQAHAQWVPGKRDTGINGHWGSPVRTGESTTRSGTPRRKEDDPLYRATLQRMPNPKPKPVDPWATMREAK
jgi:hypothetical protein